MPNFRVMSATVLSLQIINTIATWCLVNKLNRSRFGLLDTMIFLGDITRYIRHRENLAHSTLTIA